MSKLLRVKRDIAASAPLGPAQEETCGEAAIQPDVWIRPARDEDVRAIVPRLRVIDALEATVFSGRSQGEIAQVLIDEIAASLWSKSVFVGGDLKAIFGVTPAQSAGGDVGRPFMMTVRGVEACTRQVVAYSRDYVERMHLSFSRLENVIAADNTVAIGWLKWCGFHFADPFEVRTFDGQTLQVCWFWKEKD